MKDKSLRDLTVAFSILVLIFIRWRIEEAKWMGCIACAGILIALFVLYDNLKEQFSFHRRFSRIRGFFILVLLGTTIILIQGMVGMIEFSAKLVDEFSLITLLISLPEKLYLSLAAMYLNIKNSR